MRSTGLFAALILAHILMMAGRSVPLSPWALIALFWHDVLIVLLFAGFERLVRVERVLWIAYGVLVAYAALNVPIARALSSPLTWTMMRAAGGPLLDSILYYVTLSNVAGMAAVVSVGFAVPWLLRPVKPSRSPSLAVTAIVIVAIGPLAAVKVDTSGMQRNAFTALLPVRLPPAAAMEANWRSSPFAPPVSVTPDITSYRGIAAGRNVLLILLESTGASYLRPYGAPDDPMPNLTQLAGNAIVFERAYAVYPESVKGLLTVLCSRYLAFQTPAESYGEIGCPSIAQSLTHAGYRTALFHSGRFMYLGMEAVIRERGFGTLEDAGAIGGNVNSSFGVDEPAAIERILSWIDSADTDQPFFITYMPVAGHHPYATPEPGPFPNDTSFGNYQNALYYGDKSLGTLLEGLRRRKRFDNTLFVIFGDHGEAFGQHDGNFGHSLFIYEENLRVPYIIAAPGLIEGQLRSTRTASAIDTAPTVLDLLGLEIPSQAQGLSLLGRGNPMALFFTDYSLGFLGLYDSCWKYIFEVDSRRSKLFNLCRDPAETADRSQSESTRTDFYRRNVEGWIQAQRE